MRQFAWFCVSGVLAFAVDAGVLQLLVSFAGLDRYSARVLSFLCAVTVTWAFNRRITFTHGSGLPWPREWLLYVGTQLGGAGLNYAVYAALVFFVPLVHAWPVLGVAAGSVAGLALNFVSAKRLVFRGTR